MTTPIADMVELMLSQNAPADLVILAIRTAETASRDGHALSRDSHTPSVERRREADRLRQQKHRNKSKLLGRGAEANDAAQNPIASRDSHALTVTDTLFLSSSLSSKSLRGNQEVVSKKETVAVVETRAKQSRATRLPENATLSQVDLAAAIELGMSEQRAREAWAEFVDFWTGVPGARGTKLNWPGTWRNRVRQIAGKNGKSNAAYPQRSFQDDTRSVGRATERLAAGVDEGTVSFAPRPQILPSESPRDMRLLPKG